ncbi:MAG: AAA family ATPase, partial [Clostridia bacterium]|nr:AAA family ATPase [Clostridia bacterium]
MTRPRRFGKSYIADMLTAYYSRGCDSHTLFDNLKIAEEDSYKKHLNKFNVIYFDVSQIISKDVDAKTGLSELENDLVHELRKEHRFMFFRKKKLIPMLNKVCKKTHKGFIFIIDEWDSPYRERKNDSESQEFYLRFLKNLLKNREYVSLAYMTGILPIKKYCTESALNMFKEYTMLSPGSVKEFIGFTEEEVGKLCAGSKLTEKDIKDWY